MTTITEKVTSCLEILNTIEDKDGRLICILTDLRLRISRYNSEKRHAWNSADA